MTAGWKEVKHEMTGSVDKITCHTVYCMEDVSSSEYTVSTVSGEVEKMCKEAVVAWFEVPAWHFYGATEEEHGKTSDQMASLPEFELSTSPVHVLNATAMLTCSARAVCLCCTRYKTQP